MQFRFIVRAGNFIAGGFDTREDAEAYAKWQSEQRPTWYFTVTDTGLDEIHQTLSMRGK